MPIELLTPLPPGADSFTRLARQGARYVVLRELKDGTDCSYPLDSPGLVTLQEVTELDGRRYAVFPWVPGVTLRELCDALEAAGQTVPVGLMARVLADVAKALQQVQPLRAHGGLSDAAVQLGFDGAVSVLDFGAPRSSRFRAAGRVSFSADVFSLGAVLHAGLTGFEGEYAARLETLPAPSHSHPGVTPALDAVVMKALSAEPDARQSSAGEFADELLVAVGDEAFTDERVAGLVREFFADRERLLTELTSDEVESALGDASNERTQPRISAPPPSKRELVPWQSEPSLPKVTDVPPAGPRDSQENVQRLGEPEAGDGLTQPRVASPFEGEDKGAGPVPRVTGQRAALAPRRSTGEIVLASSSASIPDLDAFAAIASSESGPIPITAPPRSTGSRPALSDAEVKASGPVPAPHSDAPPSARRTGQREAVRATGQRDAVVESRDAGPRPSAPVRGTGQRDAVSDGGDAGVGASVRGTGQRDALIDTADTNPRASAPVRGTGQRDAVVEGRDAGLRSGTPARGTGQRDAVVEGRDAGPRPSAPVRGTGQRDAVSDGGDAGVGASFRGTGQRDAVVEGRDAGPRPSAPVRGTGQRDAVSDAGSQPSAPVRGTSQRAAVGDGGDAGANAPVRGTGQRDAVVESRDAGPRPSAPVRGTGQRDALIELADTNPRASAPVRSTGQRNALIDTADTNPRSDVRAGLSTDVELSKSGSPARGSDARPRATGQRAALGDSLSDGETNPRASAPAPVRKTGQRDALGAITADSETNPRASAPRMTGQRAALASSESAHEPTNPRAPAPELDEADPTNPRAKNPLSRTATTADRLWAKTQERVETPPHGVAAVPEADDARALRDEPTAVRERPTRPEPQQTAQTAQSLAPTSTSSSQQRAPERLPLGLGVVVLLLLLAVIGIGVAVLRKVQTANELEPLPEELVVVDAGAPVEAQEEDGGEDVLEVLPVLPAVLEDAGAAEVDEEADAGEEDDEEDELDGGATEDVVDAGAPLAAPAVKKTAPKKKKRRRR